MINGVLNIYKEKGFTSHDVVAKLRGILKQKKIGHTGTLDPDAEGVLPVCLGKATKLCDMLTDKDKMYEAVLLLGKTTDTQDISGTVLEERDPSGLTEEQVREYILKFIGEQDQIPPMYSALKVNGKKLYELAREGIEIERKARKITIHNIEILEIDLPRVRMLVHCSKGTYIRTLCHDIGAVLGCGGCMETLLRTRVSRFELKDSLRLAQIEEAMNAGNLDCVLTAIDAMFQNLPEIQINPEQESLIYNGNSFAEKYLGEHPGLKNEEQVRVYDTKHQFVGIYRYLEKEKRFSIEKMFL
ncbi:MAG: tRNA pseudouridine(55) synthase TruB [Schaedlerella sp.]|nr:tRNA pseudouridine(55) synthase TruB [Schaedlerella sp.]